MMTIIIIWQASWAGKNQIAHCNWPPERARRSYLARLGLPAVSREKNFPESQIINPSLAKLFRSRWLDIGLVLFLPVYGPRFRPSWSINTQKKNMANIQPSWTHTWSITHICQLNIKAWKSQLAPEGRSVGCLQTWPRSWTRFYQERTPAKRSERDFRISSRAP